MNSLALSVARRRSYVLALEDFVNGLREYRIWMLLGWQEIKVKYSRSLIGPFWISLNMAIMVLMMGPLYSKLFHQELQTYFLYLSSSIVIWGFISALINEACAVFVGAEGFIKQVKLPFSTFLYKMIWKNLIVFAHNFVVVLAVFIFFPPPIGIGMLLSLVGLVLVTLNGVWIGMILALICARFRDVPQIVTSLVSVAFFLTPIMWQPTMLGDRAAYVRLNPFYHLMEVLRGPLITGEIHYESFALVAAGAVVGFAVMFVLFARFRARVAYWL